MAGFGRFRQNNEKLGRSFNLANDTTSPLSRMAVDDRFHPQRGGSMTKTLTALTAAVALTAALSFAPSDAFAQRRGAVVGGVLGGLAGGALLGGGRAGPLPGRGAGRGLCALRRLSGSLSDGLPGRLLGAPADVRPVRRVPWLFG